VKIGNSDAVQVGDWAVAVGSPFGLEASVTAGIVSAKHRDLGGSTAQFQRFIQTDAAINPGNSGGPLVNIRGEVIGINTMIATRSGGYQGIGFALPINMAAKVYNMITRSGRVTRGSIGISFDPDESRTLLEAYGLKHGVAVSGVAENGPAEKAGLKVEDVIVAIDGRDVKDGDDLVSRVADTPIGTEITLTVDRSGKRMQFPLKIEDRTEVFRDRFAQSRERPQPGGTQGTEAKFGAVVENLSSRNREEMGLSDEAGVLVTRVVESSFADEIGLREHDVIVSINREPVSSVDDILRIQATLSAGDAVAFRVMRPFPDRSGLVNLQSRYLAGRLP
jgi:serine protease Do